MDKPPTSSDTPLFPPLETLSPVDAVKIVNAFHERLLHDTRRDASDRKAILVERLNSLFGNDRPIEALAITLATYAAATRGGDIGDIDVHRRRLRMAEQTIGKAKASENESEKTLAMALEGAILETLQVPTHATPRRTR